jgi:hypothetical protein
VLKRLGNEIMIRKYIYIYIYISARELARPMNGLVGKIVPVELSSIVPKLLLLITLGGFARVTANDYKHIPRLLKMPNQVKSSPHNAALSV